MSKVCPTNTTRVRSFFLGAALKIYAEMTYNTQNPRHSWYNHTMNPKERALHWLNIVTTGMAILLMVLIEILSHVIEQHRLFLPSPVIAALKDHIGIVLKPLLLLLEQPIIYDWFRYSVS